MAEGFAKYSARIFAEKLDKFRSKRVPRYSEDPPPNYLKSTYLRRLRSDLLNPKFGNQKSALL